MKRKSLISYMIVLTLCLTMCLAVFAACATNFDADTLDTSIRAIALKYSNNTSTPSSYTLERKIDTFDSRQNPATIYVKWTIEDQPLVAIIEGEDTVTVDIPAERNSDIYYKLRATLTDAKGRAYFRADNTHYTVVFDCVAPKGSSGNNPSGGNQGGNQGGNDTPGGNQGGNQGGTGDVTTAAATLSLIGTSTRTSYSSSQIVHSGDGITYTNDQANSSSSCYETANETWSTRAYQGSTITITYTSAMTAIVLTMDDGTYNGKQYMSGFDDMSVNGATITRDNDKVTIILTTPSTSFQSDELSSQCRIESVAVYTSGTPSAGGTTGGDSGNTGGNTSGGGNQGGETGGQAGTYTFNFATNFSTYAGSWENQYKERTITATDLGVTNANVSFVLSNGSKQDNMPNLPTLACKDSEQYLLVTATGNTISQVTFDLQEWVTQGGGAAKVFTTLTIEYSLNGSTWQPTNVGFTNSSATQITNYKTLTYSGLPSGVVAVRLLICSDKTGNQQMGIAGVTLTLQ